MIGKSLSERWTLGPLDEARAVSILTSVLPAHAEHLVQVRAQDSRMIACLVVNADAPSIRLFRELGFSLKKLGTVVIGLLGPDAARAFSTLPAHQREWLATPCGPRETKVFLVAGGTALLSLETKDGKVVVTAVPV